MIKCALWEDPIISCEKQAEAAVVYGLYSEFKKGRPHHRLQLCHEHIDELWSKCKAPVTVGLMHWAMETVNETT